MPNQDISPFDITTPEADLDDLRERLARTRWPDQIPGSGWDYGTNLEYLQDLCDTWRTKFDWRAQEDRFNRWPHYLTEIDVGMAGGFGRLGRRLAIVLRDRRVRARRQQELQELDVAVLCGGHG